MSTENKPAVAMKKEDVLQLIGTETDVQSLDLASLGAALETLTFTDSDEITSDYVKLEPGQEVRCFYLEMTEINKIGGKDGEKVPAARLVMPDGSFAINADAVVISTLRNCKRWQPVILQCTGKKKTSAGEYKTFKVYKLN